MQQRLKAVQSALGVTADTADVDRAIDDATATLAKAEQARDKAWGAADSLKAEAAAFRAEARKSQACLNGTLHALRTALSATGAETAVARVETLAAGCLPGAAP